MATPRFAYESPLAAGGRRTVRHVIGALRHQEAGMPARADLVFGGIKNSAR
ncbi:hypothetical protein [Rhizobium sp. RAF56]|jgi:hypothetical protein|uniref:hypothetical protein n=1 Tax=Rhizobium sp. RAF56 TaxID=3233062 RepID=UPI003F9A3129